MDDHMYRHLKYSQFSSPHAEINALIDQEFGVVTDKLGMVSAIGDDMTIQSAKIEMKKHLNILIKKSNLPNLLLY